ncbi:MAG: hypothetical protein ABSH34_21860 [Verrucomicrobiota bacterium]|jgi:hypothetical protein
MNDGESHKPGGRSKCDFCTFGLIVTGEGEREFLPRFFTSLMERTGCTFTLLSQIGQRNPITSPAKKLRMVGSGQTIPTSDEEEIGLPARRFLRNQPCRFLLLLDDAEEARRPILHEVFRRYRAALDTMLLPAERNRAAVHFFANMVEAYYFAHSAAVNSALGETVLVADHPGDVETIGHPKGELKRLREGFDEMADGANIVPLLDLDRILNNSATCAFLRALFAWCVRQLEENCPVHDTELGARYQLVTGAQAEITRHQ